MRPLKATDIKELNLLKHYRIIRKWACKNNDLTDAELELLIYLDCIDLFTKKDNIYTLSFKGKQLISRMYRIMLGHDDIPTSERRNKLIAGGSYTDKVMTTAIYNVNKDKLR